MSSVDKRGQKRIGLILATGSDTCSGSGLARSSVISSGISAGSSLTRNLGVANCSD